MSFRIPLSRLILAVGLVLPLGIHAQTSLDELEAAYTAAIARAEQPRLDLLEKYREGLRTLQEKKRAEGDLDSVLVINQEIETATEVKDRSFDRIPELKRLREIYDASRGRIEEGADRETGRVREAYRDRLVTEVGNLTRAGKIDEALVVKTRIEELEKQITEAGDKELLWEWKSRASVDTVGNCEMETKDKRFVLKSRGNRSWMKSKQEFKPPFRLQLRASTDSTNIRLYYKNNLAILNWEVNPEELRIHHPATNVSTGIRNQGKVSINEMHDIRIDVLLDKVIVIVDGETRGELDTNNVGLEGPVGIGPAFGSTLTIESMRVFRLP